MIKINGRASGHLLWKSAEKVETSRRAAAAAAHTVSDRSWFSKHNPRRAKWADFNKTDLWNPYQAPPAARNASSSHQQHWLLQENGLVHVSPSSAALPSSRSVFPWPLPVTGDVEDLRFTQRGVVLAEEKGGGIREERGVETPEIQRGESQTRQNVCWCFMGKGLIL